ncbi:1-acyl-sn-glycerol-3-phosphate acyltransferase [Gordonia sp. TBRC 11910]|uniref:1-acyl-sn-glycerol-3-phosphate acyltransferase n=1 Tax=Gordonia asplenii TaxID=2725283 RepID=A0A848L042_9ACTN|nr:1-acyl-sn-glycerol-3-phosphate acyltransferase [Gordonia asplenii]NMO04330.1 1-acyl-sn-glycerol-3-phosphate acyltransferase [Gordonia asplenii]
MEPVYRILEGVAHSIAAVQGVRRTYRGLENIPASGGAVLAINHTGYFDFLPMALGIYRAGRRTRFMIKSEVMDNPIMRFLVNHTGTVPVDRSAGHEAYERAVDSLRHGELVAVYPEATISRSFELKEFKSGAVRMAVEADVPIIPTIIWGAQRQWTKGGHRNMGRARLPIIVRYGVPLHVSRDDDPEAATAALRATMTALLHEVQDDYGQHPAGEFWVPARLGGGAPTPEAAKVIEDAEAAQKAAARAAKREGKSR